MRWHLIIGLVLAATAGVSSARMITDLYKGRVIREEVVRTEPAIEELTATFAGFVDGELAFEVSQRRRVVTWLKSYHEQVQVTRNTEDPGDSGVRTLLPGKEVPGDLRSETRVDDLGTVKGATFELPSGKLMTTNKDGLLIDDDEVLLRAFDGIRPDALELELQPIPTGAPMKIRLSPRELWEEVGSSETLATGAARLAAPDAGDLLIESKWDRPTYRPGDKARLLVTVQNRRVEDVVGFVRGAAALSRHDWLNGKIFYLPAVPPGEKRSFSRVFEIPSNTKLSLAHLRIGFNEYSGTKPQHAVRLQIRQPEPPAE